MKPSRKTGAPARSEKEPRASIGETVTVTLGGLVSEALAASPEPKPARLTRTLSQAIRYYLIDRDSTHAGWAYPGFLPADTTGVDHAFEVPLESRLWHELIRQAERQNVSADQLLQHAALYFAAARDEGRITAQIVEVLEREGEA